MLFRSGCVATGSTIKETELLMKEAIEFHIEGMIEEGLEVPIPISKEAEFIKINLKKDSRREFQIA